VTLPNGVAFSNYAILIDTPAIKNNDLICYFPEFYISTGMSFSVQFKTIYGDSYPIDLQGGTTNYGSMYTITSNILSFSSGSTPSMSSGVYGWNSISDNSYSTNVTVGTAFSGIYSLSADMNATLVSPYIYINFVSAGPVPVISFCSDSNVFF
jgi:hypothetical protein